MCIIVILKFIGIHLKMLIMKSLPNKNIYVLIESTNKPVTANTNTSSRTQQQLVLNPHIIAKNPGIHTTKTKDVQLI